MLILPTDLSFQYVATNQVIGHIDGGLENGPMVCWLLILEGNLPISQSVYCGWHVASGVIGEAL